MADEERDDEQAISSDDAAAAAAFRQRVDAHRANYEGIVPEVVGQLRQEWDDAQRGLVAFYDEAFYRYDACFRAAYLTGHGIVVRHRQEAVARQDRALEVLARLQSRALLTASEGRALIFTGHGGGAMALARRALELAVIGTFIVERGGDVAERYINHDAYERRKLAVEYNATATALGEPGLDPAEFQALTDRCDELARQYQHPNYLTDWGWAAKALHPDSPNPKADFRKIMQATELKRFRPLYLQLSDHVHAGAGGSAAHIVQTPNGPRFLTGPNRLGLSQPAKAILYGLLQCTSALAQHELTAYQEHAVPVVQFATLRRLANEAAAAFDAAEARVVEAMRGQDADSRGPQPSAGEGLSTGND